MRQRRAAALLVVVGSVLAGLVLVAGPASSAGGTLDPTFGTTGAARIDFGGSGSFDAVEDMALQSDGKVLVVGRTATGFAVSRLSAAGVLDTGFGTGGSVVGSSMTARGIALQSDAKVLVVGQSAATAGSLVLTRYSSTGVLDTGFGTSGVVSVAMTGSDSGGHDVAVQADGKILVLAVDAGTLAVLRYASTGVADPGFGTGGRANPSGTPAVANRLVVQPDGKVVVTTTTGTDGGALRLGTTGALDGTYGVGGVATSTNHVPRALAMQASTSKLVLGGDLGTADTKAVVARRLPTGALDPTFGTGGVATFAVSGLSRPSVRAVAIQADGGVVVVGRNDDATRASPVFVARLTPTGLLDTAFASTGAVTFTTVNSLTTGAASALLVDGNGRYLLGGSILNDHASFTNDNDFLVLRVTGVTTTTSTSTTAPVTAQPGDTVSTDPGASPTAANPLVVSVTTPVAGTVSITKSAGSAPAGSRSLAGATISAPTATVAAPIHLQFQVDVSTLPASLPLRSIVVTRDAQVAPDCASTTATTATPDPCVLTRTRSGDAVAIDVLSSHASSWTLSRPIVQRIFGDDRVLSSIAISKESYGPGRASAAVLSRSDDFADALAAIPLAFEKKGPLLLTNRLSLDDRVLAELTRVLPVGKTVYVLGGPNALSEGVVERVLNWGYDVVRLGGATRYDTAVTIATDGLGSPKLAVETTGLSFADALAAGAAAAAVGGAVLLTAGRTMPEATAAYLAGTTQRVAIGGPAAAADPDADAIVGDDRYETAVLTAKVFFEDVATIGVASGTTFADALAGGVHAASLGGPLLLLPPKGAVPVVVSIFLRDQKSPPSAYLYGGTSALAADIAAALQKALGG